MKNDTITIVLNVIMTIFVICSLIFAYHYTNALAEFRVKCGQVNGTVIITRTEAICVDSVLIRNLE